MTAALLVLLALTLAAGDLSDTATARDPSLLWLYFAAQSASRCVVGMGLWWFTGHASPRVTWWGAGTVFFGTINALAWFAAIERERMAVAMSWAQAGQALAIVGSVVVLGQRRPSFREGILIAAVLVCCAALVWGGAHDEGRPS